MEKREHPETDNFLEAGLNNIENLIVAKGRQETKLQFFEMVAFSATRDGGELQDRTFVLNTFR